MELSLEDLASPVVVDPGWSSTGNMATPRAEHTTTLLPTGKVLVTGGSNGSVLASAELYDPATGTWSATASMTTGRTQHTATLLSTGKVLVAGGYDSGAVTSAELYDPTTGAWQATSPMANARAAHTATLLVSGKVLVTGARTTPARSPPPSSMIRPPAHGRPRDPWRHLAPARHHAAGLGEGARHRRGQLQRLRQRIRRALQPHHRRLVHGGVSPRTSLPYLGAPALRHGAHRRRQ